LSLMAAQETVKKTDMAAGHRSLFQGER
jgi:hypothetical protein